MDEGMIDLYLYLLFPRCFLILRADNGKDIPLLPQTTHF